MSQLWLFETPVSVNAGALVSVTWSPRTFNSVNYGNFTLNLWILRDDSRNNEIVNSYVPSLLSYNHSVFDNSVLWLPSPNEVDVNVTQAGAHQMAWEQTKNNVGQNPLNTTFEGFSQGFNVRGSASSSSSSSSSTATTSATATESSTSSSSSALATTTTSSPETTLVMSGTLSNSLPSQVSNPSSAPTSKDTILGLSIGLGCLLLLCIAGGVWGMSKYRRARQTRLSMQPPPLLHPQAPPPPSPPQPPPPPSPLNYTMEPKANYITQSRELDGRWQPRDTYPVELPNNIYVGNN